MLTPPKPPLSPIAQAQIERSLARYEGLVPPEGMAALREVLEDTLSTHPVAVRLLDHLRERAVPASSGTVPNETSDALRAARGDKTGGDPGAW